jgi:hypothetical protein
VTCSGGGGAPPNNTLTEQAPPDIAGWRGVLRGRRGLHPGALSEAMPVEDHSIRTRSAFAAQEPLVWMNHDESRRIVDARSATPIRMARAPSVVSSWYLTAGEAITPGRFRAVTEPTGDMEANSTEPSGPSPPERACSREARRQAPRLRRIPGFQGRRSLSPAKGSAIGRTQGAFHQESSPRGWTWPGKPRQIMTTRRVSPVHRLFPSCGEGALAFLSHSSPALTRQGGARLGRRECDRLDNRNICTAPAASP